MEIKRIDYDFSVCKVADYSFENLMQSDDEPLQDGLEAGLPMTVWKSYYGAVK